MCVIRRDPYTGTDLERAWTIDRIKLPVKERNQYVFKGKAGCMWRMRVGFIDTARCIQGEAVPEKESHFEVKWSHFQYFHKMAMLLREAYNGKRWQSVSEESQFGFLLSQQNISQCLKSPDDTLAGGKINSFQLDKVILGEECEKYGRERKR